MATAVAPPQSAALERLTAYPVIKESIDTTKSMLQANPLSNYALNTATVLSQSILARVIPVVPYKEKADDLANKTLDFAEGFVGRVRATADNGVAVTRSYAHGINERFGPILAQPVAFIGQTIDASPLLSPYLSGPYQNVLKAEAALIALQDRLVQAIATFPHDKAQVTEALQTLYKEAETLTVYLTSAIKGLPVNAQHAAQPYVNTLSEGLVALRQEISRDASFSEKATNIMSYTRERLDPLLASIKLLVLRSNPVAPVVRPEAEEEDPAQANNGPRDSSEPTTTEPQ
jgi:hypothetical protein